MSTATRVTIGLLFALVIVCIFGGMSYDRMLEQSRRSTDVARAEHAAAVSSREAALLDQEQQLEATQAKLATVQNAHAEDRAALVAGWKSVEAAHDRQARTLRSELAAVRSELRRVTADRDSRIKELDEAIVEIRAQHDRMLVKRDRRIGALEEQLQQQREEHARALAAKDEQMRGTRRELARTKGAVARITAENGHLREAYDKLNENHTKSVEAVERLTGSVRLMRGAAAAQEKEKAGLLEKLSAAQKERNELAKQVDDLREQLEKAKEDKEDP